MSAYYNESNQHAARWLRNLATAGLICPGDVDGRDIREVCANDIKGYTQHHFFAGIGIWSLALRMAGWPDDRPVTTGSCPCQPFSGAGKGDGFDDERHLWPAWHWLIQQYRPYTIFGEQVASKDAGPWIDLVSADLETLAYAVAPVVLPVAGIGGPNGRHRFFWVAGTDAGRLVYSKKLGSQARSPHTDAGYCQDQPQRSGDADRLGHAGRTGLPDTEPQNLRATIGDGQGRTTEQPSGPSDPWRELEWIDCLDGKRRPTQPGLFPLAPRHPGDVGKLRAYGNAISPQIAAEVIRAYMECRS